MAQVDPMSSSLGSLVTYVASAEHVVNVAKNTVDPVNCDWGAGTRVECAVVLGSWMLLQKHLHFIHCHPTMDGFVCRLPKCNRQLHLSSQALADHIDSAHLSRLPLSCPIPNCATLFLKGIESLIKHYEDCHGNLEGKIVQLPLSTGTWEPIPKHLTITNGSTTPSVTPASLPLPSLPGIGEMQPGSVLVANVNMKQSQGTKLGPGEGVDGWFSSQPGMSQSQGFTSSQGIHPMARRKRTRVKQLEKMREQRKEEDEEGVPTITLDDLVGFDGPMGLRIDVNTRHHRGWLGMRGKRGTRDPGQWNLNLATIADQGMIFGQRPQQLMIDMSCPQPMLTRVHGNGNPKSVLFDVVARKVDEMERIGVVDMTLM